MSRLSTSAVEYMAITEFRVLLDEMTLRVSMQPDINENDRTPVWGGCISFYDNYKKKISKRQINQETESKESFNRIVFAKARDNLDISSYRFLGIFNKTGETVEKTINGKILTFRVCRLQNKILKRSQVFDR